MATAKSKAETTTDETTQGLEADVRQLRKDIDKLVQQLSKTSQHSYGTARKAAAVGVDQLKSQAQDLESQLVDTVREKPVTALAIAAGVGYFLAMLGRR